MTKKEIKQALDEGKKVRHKYFSDNGFISKLDDNWFLDEEGLHLPAEDFWNQREKDYWENGWSIVEDK